MTYTAFPDFQSREVEVTSYIYINIYGDLRKFRVHFVWFVSTAVDSGLILFTCGIYLGLLFSYMGLIINIVQ